MLHFVAAFSQGDGVPPPLDGITTFAAYSYSRKLRTAHAGSAFKVRRSSDNTTQDIGFSGNNVDTAALLTFVGSGSGYIDTVYDQSGGGLDLTQATTANQPRIVNAGSLETIGGKLAAYFDGTNDYLARATVSVATAAWSMAAVVKRAQTTVMAQPGSWDGPWCWGTANTQTGSGGFLIPIENTGFGYKAGTAGLFGDGWTRNGTRGVVSDVGTYLTDPYPVLWEATLSATTAAIRRNGTTLAKRVSAPGVAITGSGALNMGTASVGNSFYWPGHIGELILFNADAETDLAMIRPSITSWWTSKDPDPETRGIKGVSGQFINAGQILQYERTQPWSVTFSMLEPKLAQTNHAIILCNVSTAPAFKGWELMINSSGRPAVRIINNIAGPNFVGVAGDYYVYDGSPHMVTVTYDGSSTAAGVKFYVDGTLVANVIESGGDTLTGTILEAGAEMYVANQKNYETTFWMNGISLFGLQVANVVRDATWAATYTSDSAFPTPDSNAVLSYRFNERTGLSVHDDSASGFNGTLSNASLWI
jgi:Alpha-L-arabinofuranosidase B, catalytic